MVFTGCQRAALPAAERAVRWQSDPIVVPGHGEVARADYRRHVATSLAGPWLRFLAMDAAVRSELERQERNPPSTELLAKVRGFVRGACGGGLLRDWLPAPNGDHRSGKSELDLTWCLARIWLLRGDGELPENALALQGLFLAEVALRRPEAAPDGATCQGFHAGAERVYPDLLALLTPEHRERLLHECAGVRKTPASSKRGE